MTGSESAALPHVAAPGLPGSVPGLVEVKSLGGTNFIRPDRVIAIQSSPTGTSLIVMEGGATVHSSESTRAIAARIEAADQNR
jgi:hypothetical protein